MSVYDFHDRFNTSTVEEYRHLYVKAIWKVEDELALLRSEVQTLSTSVARDLQSMYGSFVGDTSSGLFKDDYESALDRLTASWNALVGDGYHSAGNITQAINALEARLAEMHENLRTLDRMWLEEDEREQYYLKTDIPFL